MSPHSPFCKTRCMQLQFRLELVKQLIGGFCGRKKMAGAKRKDIPLDNAIAMPNLPGHMESKFEGRKHACIHCSSKGRRNPSARTPVTLWMQQMWCELVLWRVFSGIPHRTNGSIGIPSSFFFPYCHFPNCHTPTASHHPHTLHNTCYSSPILHPIAIPATLPLPNTLPPPNPTPHSPTA